MGRKYIATFEKVSVAAVQDLLCLIDNGMSGNSYLMKVRRVWVMCVNNTPPTAQMLALRCSRMNPSITDGSGGTTPTIRQCDPGDAASNMVAHANDTTQTSTSGTKETVWEGGCHLYQGLDLVFSDPILFQSTWAFSFELITTPGAAILLSGGIEWEEEGHNV